MKKSQLTLVTILSLISAIGLTYFFNFGRSSNYLFFLVALVAAVSSIRPAIAHYQKRRLIIALIFAIPFAFATLIGSKIPYGTTEFAPWALSDILKYLALFIVVAALVIDLLFFVDHHHLRHASATHPRRLWLLATLSLLVCWLPYFLACCPGLISVDTAVQFQQGLSGTGLSNWHPILHTLFLGAFLNLGTALGGVTLGVAMAVLAQMLVVAILLGYVISWLAKHVASRFAYIITWLFFAFCPIIALYAITPWKDVLFSSIFLVLLVKVYEFVIEHRRLRPITIKALLPLAVIAFISAFFRNGGIATILALSLALLIYYRQSWRAILGVFLPFILLVALIQGPGYRALGIASSPFMESLSVPSQQLAYTTLYGNLTEEELTELSQYTDVAHLVSAYNPMHADAAKTSFDYDLVEDHKADFLKLWAKILSHNFPAYLKAYLFHTYAYWYIGSPSWVNSFENTHDPLWFNAEYQDANLFGDSAKALLEKASLGLFATSWFGWLCSVGVLVWFTILSLLVYLYKKSSAGIIITVVILCYLATLLIASPVSWIYRYVYILLLALPVLVAFWFTPSPKR